MANLQRMISELVAQRDQLSMAIAALERVRGEKRRGRPPKWMKPATVLTLPKRGTRKVA